MSSMPRFQRKEDKKIEELEEEEEQLKSTSPKRDAYKVPF